MQRMGIEPTSAFMFSEKEFPSNILPVAWRGSPPRLPPDDPLFGNEDLPNTGMSGLPPLREISLESPLLPTPSCLCQVA